jgi:hypothetical protein
LQKYNNWVSSKKSGPFHWLGVDLNLSKVLGHTWDPMGAIDQFLGSWEARKKRVGFLNLACIHKYIENFQELNLGKVLYQLQPPNDILLLLCGVSALWRVINVCKDSLSLFSLCLLGSNSQNGLKVLLDNGVATGTGVSHFLRLLGQFQATLHSAGEYF